MRPAAHAPRLKPAGEAAIFAQSLLGFALAALVMLGMGGSVYRLVAPGGWLAQLFGRSLAGGLAAVLAFLVIGLCAWLSRGWISVRQRNRHAELFVYFFAALGAYYAYRMLGH